MIEGRPRLRAWWRKALVLVLALAGCDLVFSYRSPSPGRRDGGGDGRRDGRRDGRPADQRGDRPAGDRGQNPQELGPSPCKWALIPTGVQENLRGIWVDPKTPAAWVVGGKGTILRCTLKICRSEGSPTKALLRDVFGSNAGDIWAVGDGSTVLHYDGARWSQQPVPTEIRGNFRGVWADTAAVWIASQSDHQVLVKYANSTTWKQTLPSNRPLYAVWGFSSTDLWVDGNGDGSQSPRHHYGTKGWSTATGSEDIYRLWGSGGEVFGVGDRVIVHYRSKSWASTPVAGVHFRGVWGRSLGDVWAVGRSGAIWHRAASTWSRQLVNVSSGGDYFGVGGTPTGCGLWIVGPKGELIVRR